MDRFTAIHYDTEQDEYYRVVCSAQSADDVETKTRQFLYEKGLADRDFNSGDITDLTTFGDTICVFAGDHPNLIIPNKEVNDLVILPEWQPQDETPAD